MSENSKDNKMRYFKWSIIYIIAFLIILATLIDDVIEVKYDLVENAISNVTIRASKDVEDKLSTEQNIEKAISGVVDQYEHVANVKENIVTKIDLLFSNINRVKGDENLKSDQDKISSIKRSINIVVSDEDLLTLLKLDNVSLQRVHGSINSLIGAIYDNVTIRSNHAEDLKSAAFYAEDLVNYLGLIVDEKKICSSIVVDVLEPNQLYDEQGTIDLKNDTKNKVAPVIIKKDDIVVKQGEKVTVNDLEVLKSLGQLGSGFNVNVLQLTALSLVIIITFLIQFLYLRRKKDSVFLKTKNLILINAVMVILIILTKIFNGYSYLIPFAAGPIFILLLTGKEKATLVTTMLYLPIISMVLSYDAVLILIIMLSIIITCMINKKITQRNDVIVVSFIIGICGFITTLAFGVFRSMVYDKILFQAFFSFCSGILSGVIIIGLLPILETLFKIVTPLKLLELSNFNNALLKKLLMEAPGTYNHSISVANIAEAGAEAINADHIFASVASYYHDVGKLLNPMYFKENQINMDNPHDNISNYESAQIILSHTIDGVALSKKYKIPESIKDIMVEHHGTTLVKYFYLNEKNKSANPDEIKEDDFRYKGRIPKTKESAIIMIADAVEATVRSLKEKSRENIYKTIDSIIKSRLEEGQFDDAPITLSELSKIREAIYNVLIGVYHERVEYPKDEVKTKLS